MDGTTARDKLLSPDATNPQVGPLSPQYRALTLGMVAMITLVAFEALAVATAMPTVAHALNGLRLYALVFASTLGASVIGIVLAGPWCDSSGPARPLTWGLAAFVGGLIIAGLAQNMMVLLIGRTVQGFGNGIISVALYAVIGKAYPESLRPKIFSAFSAGWVVPSMIGPAISGLIVQHFNWRVIFLIVPVIALPFAWFMRPALLQLPRGNAAPHASHRALSFALITAFGLCLLHLAGQEQGSTLVAMLLPALALVFAGTWQLLPKGTLLAGRGLPTVLLLRALGASCFFGTETFLPLMLTRIRGISPMWAGFSLTIGAVGWASASWFQGHGRYTLTRPQLLKLGMAMMCSGCLLVTATLSAAVPVQLVAVGWLATGLGMGLLFPSLAVLLLKLSPPEAHGRNASALQLCDSISIATVLAVGGSIYAALLTRSEHTAFLLIFLTSALLALMGVLISHRVQPA